ncbi:MAG TPA: hypothetical protein VMT35_02325 [Ignavibacteriaceae bacterium]|nr:hypothetical protein [Ignavibacteriaceae bacterium]
MKIRITLIQNLFFILILTSSVLPQNVETKSAGEISFDDAFVKDSFNKIYLLEPGEKVSLKNLCTSTQIAIGLKDYIDVSSSLALVYQKRDSLSLRIVTEYEKIGKSIDDLSLGLRMISDSLQKVSSINLQPSITLLSDSNRKLEDSNKQLDNAMLKLDEINSDLNKIQLTNIWKYLGFGALGLAVGIVIGAVAFN